MKASVLKKLAWSVPAVAVLGLLAWWLWTTLRRGRENFKYDSKTAYYSKVGTCRFSTSYKNAEGKWKCPPKYKWSGGGKNSKRQCIHEQDPADCKKFGWSKTEDEKAASGTGSGAAPAGGAALVPAGRAWLGPMGGNGGKDFSLECGPGGYLQNMAFWHKDDVINILFGACSTGEHMPSGTGDSKTQRGMTHKNSSGKLTRATVNFGDEVHGLRFVGAEKDSEFGGSTAYTAREVACPSGQVFTGIRGKEDERIDQLEFQCGTA